MMIWFNKSYAEEINFQVGEKEPEGIAQDQRDMAVAVREHR
jgi:hypothetical protein